ncbi:MAG TPA: hypothetical protein VJP89_20585 [Pyrinomonadaceae bacterium]|nr:hypothetical protein [Pyrinomonadaceae bacterium]
MPNVTAIDCKQAGVYGQLEQKGGMSFTVYEARAAFCSLPIRFTLAAVRKNFQAPVLARTKQRVDETPAT